MTVEVKTGTPSSKEKKGRRRSRISEERCARILASALAAFSAYGLHGARLETIAENAGISKTNLLYYYPSKEDLYQAVFKHTLDTWLAPMKAFEATQEALEAINRYIRIKLESSRDSPQASRLFCMEMLQGAPALKELLKTELKAVVDDKSAVIREWINQGKLAPIDPYQLFYLLWAATQHYADFAPQVEALSGKTLDDPEFFESALKSIQDVVGAGLTPSGRARGEA